MGRTPDVARHRAGFCVLAAAAILLWTAAPAGADDVPATDTTVPQGAAPSGSTPQPAPARSAKDRLEDIWTRDTLSGDWGGLRTDLAEHGICPKMNLRGA